MNNRKLLPVFAVIVVLAIGGFFWRQHSQQKLIAHNQVANLIAEADQERGELGMLYQKRVSYLLTWRDHVQSIFKKLPADLVVSEPVIAAKDFVPKTQEDFVKLDRVQNELSEELSKYLQTKDVQKERPDGLEKLEESINRKRHSYHVKAFEANRLIAQYEPKTQELPTFDAEKSLLKQGLFK
jgi:hypothetical protein